MTDTEIITGNKDITVEEYLQLSPTEQDALIEEANLSSPFYLQQLRTAVICFNPAAIAFFPEAFTEIYQRNIKKNIF